MPLRWVTSLVLLLGFWNSAIGAQPDTSQPRPRPLKVFILAGQSNMQGSAHHSTFAALGDDPTTATLRNDVLDQEGHPTVCEHAWITYLTGNGHSDSVLSGKVQVGYGFDGERIGPEYGFGIAMDKALDEPVLIIKAAWGGKSLAVDFRPPGAGAYQPSDREQQRGETPSTEQVGHYFRAMMAFVQSTLQDADSIRKIVPDYTEEQGYEICGFVWFQGWNDMCNRHHIDQYTDNMIHFIHDVRSELDSPQLPFIVGILGVYGADPDSRRFDKGLPVSDFRKAQFAAVAEYDQRVEARFRGRVMAVDSGPYYELGLSDIYWKRRLVGEWKQRLAQGQMTPSAFQEECDRFGFGDGELTADEQQAWQRGASNAEYHYLGSGKTFIRFGEALANAMLALQPPSDATSMRHAGIPQRGQYYPVTQPPTELGVDSMYTKYVDAGGYPVLASANVNDYALKEAAFLIDQMLARRPEVKRAMVGSGSRLVILAYNEFTTDLPEFAHFKPKDFWDARARGTGGSQTDPYCSCGEENLLGYPGDPYSTECILIHEFAHNIHLRGLAQIDPTFDERLKQTYDRAMAAGLWKGKYASVNHHEYFAEGVQSWFDNNREPDHDHNHVNTRKELREYDPGLARMCEEAFGDTELVYTKPATRLTGHLQGYAPQQAPTFRWPSRLDKVRGEIRQQAVERSGK